MAKQNRREAILGAVRGAVGPGERALWERAEAEASADPGHTLNLWLRAIADGKTALPPGMLGGQWLLPRSLICRLSEGGHKQFQRCGGCGLAWPAVIATVFDACPYCGCRRFTWLLA
jgi:hypothetical protein